MSLVSITLIGEYYVSESNGTCQEGDAGVLGHQYNPVGQYTSSPLGMAESLLLLG